MATLPTRTAPPRPPSLSQRLSDLHESEMQRLRWENRVEMARLGEESAPGHSPETAERHRTWREAQQGTSNEEQT